MIALNQGRAESSSLENEEESAHDKTKG